jgi:hypothetical protein
MQRPRTISLPLFCEAWVRPAKTMLAKPAKPGSESGGSRQRIVKRPVGCHPMGAAGSVRAGRATRRNRDRLIGFQPGSCRLLAMLCCRKSSVALANHGGCLNSFDCSADPAVLSLRGIKDSCYDRDSYRIVWRGQHRNFSGARFGELSVESLRRCRQGFPQANSRGQLQQFALWQATFQMPAQPASNKAANKASNKKARRVAPGLFV